MTAWERGGRPRAGVTDVPLLWMTVSLLALCCGMPGMECLGRGQEAESLLFLSEGEDRMQRAGCESFLSLTPPDECSREPEAVACSLPQSRGAED